MTESAPDAAEHLLDSKRFEAPARPGLIPGGLLIIGVLLTFLVARHFEDARGASDQARFDRAAQHVRTAITDRLTTYTSLLRGGAGLFAAFPGVDEAAFRAYVERLDLAHYYPGIQGIGFARRQGNRDAYPIAMLEPHDRRNLHALGYDMFTERVRREAMIHARDTGAAAASGAVTLVQEIDAHKQPGFLIYVPVYAGGVTPATVEERQDRIIGFVYSPFRSHDLFAAILHRETAPEIGFEVYDGEHANSRRLLHRTNEPEARAAAFNREELITVADRPWLLRLHSTPAFEATLGRNIPALIAITGTLFSLVLFVITFALEHSQRRVAAARSRCASPSPASAMA